MVEKNWLGADLIFDLDADHIKGAEKMTYEETLQKVKEEFIRLIDDFLLSDFGFEEQQLMIVFSGGRGYHIHIRDPRVLQLTSHERREIVDYITGRDLDMDWIFPKKAYDSTSYGPHVSVKHKIMMPDKNAGGWKEKLREGIIDLTFQLEEFGEDESKRRLSAYEGVGQKTADGIYDDLFVGEIGKRGVDRMREEENLEVFSADSHLKAFLSIVKGEVSIKMKGREEEMADLEDVEMLMVKERLEGETDEPVTSDIKRLIRLPSSLHGKTGLTVMPLSRNELDEFEPLRDAVSHVFTDEPIKIEVQNPVKVNIKGELFDLKKGEYKVPEYAAIFLLCRRNAVLSSEA
jgi:DNA primase small subunit